MSVTSDPTKNWSVQEVAHHFRVRRSTIYRLLETVPVEGFRKVGGDWCFDPQSAQRMLAQRQDPSLLS